MTSQHFNFQCTQEFHLSQKSDEIKEEFLEHDTITRRMQKKRK